VPDLFAESFNWPLRMSSSRKLGVMDGFKVRAQLWVVLAEAVHTMRTVRDDPLRAFPHSKSLEGFDVSFRQAAGTKGRSQRCETHCKAAEVQLAVLAMPKGCTGEAARRRVTNCCSSSLPERTSKTFERFGVREGAKRIVSHCPHCVNSFRQDYPNWARTLKPSITPSFWTNSFAVAN